jgi:hypothetical protein
VFVEQAATSNRDVLQQLTKEYSVSRRKIIGNYHCQDVCLAQQCHLKNSEKQNFIKSRNITTTAEFVMPVAIFLS